MPSECFATELCSLLVDSQNFFIYCSCQPFIGHVCCKYYPPGVHMCIPSCLSLVLSFSFFLGEHGVLAPVCHMEARGHCQVSFSIAFPFVFGDRFSCLTCNWLFQMDWLPSKPMGFIFFQIWPFKLELNTQPPPLAFYVGTREPDSDRSSYKHSRYWTTEPSPSLNFYSINLLID